ncbi:hypothetical protein DHEL01_v202719 [Diaporthe helianthi]|uniref:Uncharacterized protein n=1 Tax=Diaporthe helianthi TaxID=158607 RepID=A0A2P5I8S3_DIAHE|nr:hypothetical protein DHEL01_v202719 [Diaporthe helianthi]
MKIDSHGREMLFGTPPPEEVHQDPIQRQRPSTRAVGQRQDASARIENPLSGLGREQVTRLADDECPDSFSRLWHQLAVCNPSCPRQAKEKTLEELDAVFNVPLRVHAKYGLQQFEYFIHRYIFWRHEYPQAAPRQEIVYTSK